MAISERISPMRKHSEVCWSSTPDHTRVGYRGPPRRLWNVLTTMACVAFGMAIITTTIGSLTQKGASALLIASGSETPSEIDTALAPPPHRPSTQPRRAVRRRRAPAMTLNSRFAIRHVQKKSERSKPHGGPIVWQTCLHRGSTDFARAGPSLLRVRDRSILHPIADILMLWRNRRAGPRRDMAHPFDTRRKRLLPSLTGCTVDRVCIQILSR